MPQHRFLMLISVVLMAAPWLWPFLLGPLPAMLPDLLAWAVAAILLCLLPSLGHRKLEAIAWGWLIAAVLNAVIALLQYFDLENSLHPWLVYAEPGIAYGNIQQANLLATLLSVGLLSLIHLIYVGRIKTWLAVLFGVSLMLGHAVAASRTGLIELLCVVALLLYWRPWAVNKMMPWLLAGAAVLLVAGSVFPYILETFYDVEVARRLLFRISLASSCQSRLVIWSNVIELIQMRPWTGWGWDGLLYAHYIQPMEGERACIKLSNAHNLFLQLAVEYGVPFAAGIFLFLLWTLWRFKPWRAQQASERLGWSVLLMIGFHSLVEFPLWFGYFQLMFGLALVLIFSSQTGVLQSQENAVLVRMRWMLATFSLSILALLALDYHRASQLYLPPQFRSKWYGPDVMKTAQGSVLFKSHALIGQVLQIPITKANAELMLEAAQQALRIAPDSRIIRRLLQAATIAGREDLVKLHTMRYKAAWPKEYEEWRILQSTEQK
ncbi:O-antigen ligase family protein [Variovorax sp. PCZ-1]|uniref:PglL family O-oligosaccharyltransferase n=1 Tax=Variovorax sp. PCZ-1 TaxID=2835533 RepID=UPI001BCB55EB|nr:O-antigen ligase family protein [Variovorax sp. PCZ-1]MBS7806055.1 O-antigen ligase C-terminal domain-containing protein [Variovorax sp. PCZ-1]